METGEYDAIILAATGLQKMNMIDIATEIFEISTMLPAVGQGILGIELVDREGYVYELVKKLRHEPTKQAADAERAFLIALGGGCNLPIAAYASIEEEEITIHGVFASEDGICFAANTIAGKVEDRKELARTLALQLKEEVDIKKNQKIEA